MFNIFKRTGTENDPYDGVGMGDLVEDTITGFSGVVIARTEYLTGCNQVHIQPVTKTPDEIKTGAWLDVERVRVLEKDKVSQSTRRGGADVPKPPRLRAWSTP